MFSKHKIKEEIKERVIDIDIHNFYSLSDRYTNYMLDSHYRLSDRQTDILNYRVALLLKRNTNKSI